MDFHNLEQPKFKTRMSLYGLYVNHVQVYDECALSQRVREEMYKCYPNAKRAHLKSGGNFPYLSRADEVNLYLQASGDRNVLLSNKGVVR